MMKPDDDFVRQLLETHDCFVVGSYAAACYSRDNSFMDDNSDINLIVKPEVASMLWEETTDALLFYEEPGDEKLKMAPSRFKIGLESGKKLSIWASEKSREEFTRERIDLAHCAFAMSADNFFHPDLGRGEQALRKREILLTTPGRCNNPWNSLALAEKYLKRGFSLPKSTRETMEARAGGT